MSYLKKIAAENRFWVTIYLGTGIVLAFFSNLGASYYKRLIDGFTDGTLSIWGILLYGSILLLTYVGNYLDNYPVKKLENGIYLDLKLLAFRKAGRIDYQSYQTLGTGKLIQRIENGADAGKSILVDFYFEMIRQLLPSILFSMFFILQLNRIIALTVLAGYILVFLVTNLLLKSLYQLKEKILVNEELFQHYLTRGFMEMVTFRLNKRFRYEIRKAESAKKEIVDAKIRLIMIHEAFFTIFALIQMCMKIGILLYAWFSKAVSIGTVIALLALLENAYTPVAIFNVLFVQYKLDRTAFKRYEEFLELPDDVQISAGKTIENPKGRIEINSLVFDYDRQKVFRNFSVILRAGEKVALAGESGSGKSTLVKLIAGLLKPCGGSILVDGEELGALCLDSYYDAVTYISQESPVFDGTLKENLVFDLAAEESEILKVLKKVCLLEWFEKLEEGLETRLGERGITLSGGERQRLALARLWFRRNQIIILDEATSALDNLTEEAVMKEVLAVAKENTLIAVAHRFGSVRDFGRVILFRDGSIAGDGTFSELLETNVYFRKLYEAGKQSC